jgi:hypothetical protein
MVENLRPRGIGEILDAAVALYRARFGSLLRLTALVVVPVQVLNVLITLSTTPSDVTFGATGPTPVYDERDAVWVPLAGTLVSNIVLVLSTAFATAAVMRLVADTYLDAPITTGESAQLAMRRLPAVLGVATITGLMIIAGTFACVIPGLFLHAVFAVAMPALLLEGTRVGQALSRSVQLTKGRRWQSFSVVYVGSMLTGLVSFGLTLLISGAIAFAVHGTVALAIAQGVSGAVTTALTTPFVAAATIVLYFDLRVRAEGFDIQMALHELDRARASRSGAVAPAT